MKAFLMSAFRYLTLKKNHLIGFKLIILCSPTGKVLDYTG